ncbi:hypothetical protein B0T24DRAFT_719457 [Lasiosphaeria ovina]|uniref:Uncharacterized protein n=1 Tax=Lasiosphaeria ovina TaxID=92902 RepID=A0AAE0KJ63_9PEZI|nr:hypothetical protein B0T24DRAFT_719457 [Lasiosphaeria ovina]
MKNRIWLSYPLEAGAASISGVWLEVSEPRLRALRRCSPLFERHILRLLASSTYVWTINDPTCGAAKVVLERAVSPDPTWLAALGPHDLCRYSSALWYLNVVPTRLPEDAYRAWRGHASISNPAPPDPPSPLVGAPPSVARSSASLYWWTANRNASDTSPEVSLSVATAALVFDQPERFAAEIKYLIWEVQGNIDPTDTARPILVERLCFDHPRGLKVTRDHERAGIWSEVKDFVNNLTATKNPQAANSIMNCWPKSLDGQSIRGFLQQFHRNLFPKDSTTDDAVDNDRATISQPPVGGDSKGSAVSSKGLVSALMALDKKVKRGEKDKLARELLQRLDQFTLNRQEEVTNEILAWRDSKVADWNAILDEDPANNVSTSNGPAPSGRDSSNAAPYSHGIPALMIPIYSQAIHSFKRR